MSGTNLFFDIDQAAKLAEHSREKPLHRMSLEQRYDRYGTFDIQPGEEREAEACLWLVKDSGIYLLSPGLDQYEDIHEKPPVLYAKGYDPAKDDDVWDRSRDAVGADDFVQTIPLAWVDHAVERGWPQFVINSDEKGFELMQPSVGKRKGGPSPQ